MRLILLLIAFSCSCHVFSDTVSVNRDHLNGDFSFSEGNLLQGSVKADLGQIDNFLRTETSKQNTSYVQISPELFIQTQGEESLFQIKATLDYLAFEKFSSDDHVDFSVLSKVHFKLAESQKLFVTGFIGDDYEYRGTGLSLGEPSSIDEGDTKRNEFFNVGYLYGHQDSLARAKILLGYRDFSYQTRASLTSQLSYSSNYLQADFDYLITGKTYFSTKVQLEDFNYQANVDLERKQYLALAGVKWHSSELTQLHLLMGYEKAVFNNETFANKARFAWQINLLWNPIERIRINFGSGSQISDSFKIAKSINFSDYYSVDLTYDFTDRIALNMSGKMIKEDVVEVDNEIEEEHFETTVRLQYHWREWLSIFTQFSYDNFDSTVVINNYDVQAASVGVVVTF